MAVGHEPVKSFDDWYVDRKESQRDGTLDARGLAPCADAMFSRWQKYKTEMDARVHNYESLVKIVDAEVMSPKPDLPNVSSGETAGMVRRMARNLVQHTPNVDVICEFDDDSPKGIFARHILKTKIIGDDLYSNDMQQHLFASTKSSLTLGFSCVVPILQQDAAGGWSIKYDTIHYRDVFPEPGAKDIRQAHDVFVRRYLTKGDVKALIRANTAGWDIAALRTMVGQNPPAREAQSVDHQQKKRGIIPEGYEIVTWYSDTGDAFLTFDGRSKNLLRIEQNKHPLKWHPVFFLIMEEDEHQPLGKSQVELVLGRQEFQDLLLNGAMKQWYRNLNPAIIGYGVVDAAPNLGPGKFTKISNPNARLEAFEVNTQTLLQYQSIATGNAANMQQLVGHSDQMATQSTTGGMMSQTPQGVDAQQQMVDITTNNYQKAIENFFSRYCSYALTIYFQELKSVSKVKPTADTRQQLIAAGIPAEAFRHEEYVDEEGNKVPADGSGLKDGELDMKFAELATEYWVRAVPGSLVEMEDEKQLRILNQLFVPLSQAMPALAATQDQEALRNASAAMQFIIQKQLELSGSAHSTDLKRLMQAGPTEEFTQDQAAASVFEERMGEFEAQRQIEMQALVELVAGQQQQMGLLTENVTAISSHLGIPTDANMLQEAA